MFECFAVIYLVSMVLVISATKLCISCIRVGPHRLGPFKVGHVLYIKHDLMNGFCEHNVTSFVAVLVDLVLFFLPLSFGVVILVVLISSLPTLPLCSLVILYPSIFIYPS